MSINYDIKDLIQNLIDLEADGEEFYTKAARNVTDLAIRDLFENLAKQEEGHKKLYTSILKELGAVVEVDEDYHAFLKEIINEHFAFQSTAPEKFATVPEALDFAIRLEEDSIKFLAEFEKLLGGKRQDLIDRIKGEEEEHLRVLVEVRKKH